ncbi:putative spermatogenesis-associated protein 31C1 [Manis pentadactyla]|uniref:putative spermatogenesis-associated protein 31C1 n=1 Tax=Manis pentadactyla TaxID=143292 RepID=UPI00255C83BD|nr:putative spermatogenesis-associated protein 31C1 [Manis pentadactyla]
MGPRCPPLPGRLGPPGPVCSWLHRVPPVLSSHLSRILDKSGDHRSRQDTPGESKSKSLIPTRHPERPTLQKEPESRRARSSAVKRPQEVCSVPTSTCRGVSKGWKPRVNTCHGTHSLELNTREMLEARTRRLRAQHRRRVLLKVVQALAVYRLKKTHAWRILQSALAAPGTCVSGIPGRLKFPDLVGKAPQAFPGETLETEEAASSTGRPLLARSRVCVEMVWGGNPLGDDHRCPSSCPIGQEGRPPIQRPTLSVTGGSCQNGMMEQGQRGSPGLGPCSAMGRDEPREESGGQASQETCGTVTMLEVTFTSQSLRATEASEATALPPLQPQSRVTPEAASQDLIEDAGMSEAPGTRESPVPCIKSVSLLPGEPYHNTEAESELKPKVKVPSQNHPRHCPPHMPLSRDKVASPVSPCRPQSRPTGEHEEGSAALGPRQAVTVSRPARVRGGVHSAGTKCPQCTPGETQGPPESSFAARLTLFLQSIKSKHQYTLPQPKLSPATARSQGSFARRSTVENADADSQAVMRAGRPTLEDKLAVLHGLQGTELKAPIRACHHSHGQHGSPKAGKISHTPCCHHPTQQGQTCLFKERQVRRGEPLERVTLNKEQLDLSSSTSQSHKRTLSSAVSRCQGGPAVQIVPGQQRHCPRHCPLRRGV